MLFKIVAMHDLGNGIPTSSNGLECQFWICSMVILVSRMENLV